MKHVYFWLSCSLLVFICFGACVPSIAQTRARIPVYDQYGQPWYVQSEVIVSFNHRQMNLATTDNRGIQSAPLSSFLKPAALVNISAALGFDASEVQAYKVFPNLISADTIMVTPQGDTLDMGPSHSVLLLIMPSGIDEIVAANRLIRAWPNVIYAHLNAYARATATSGAGMNTSLAAFPSPAQTSVSLMLPGINPGNAVIELLNDKGQLLRTIGRKAAFDAALAPSRTEAVYKVDIPLQGLPNGRYHYRVTSPAGVHKGVFLKAE